LIAAAGIQPGQRVLDVACGTGYFARMIARAVGPSGVVVGIDASPEMIDYASQKAAQLALQYMLRSAGSRCGRTSSAGRVRPVGTNAEKYNYPE
jgi:ubiquinone/menaquinone biosynthesis C-methylase UbiE